MAYDLELVDRLRAVLSDQGAITEQRMFGSLAFLVDGRIAVCASNGGGLLLRVDRDQQDTLAEDPRAGPFTMGTREMVGWLHIDLDASVADDELSRWVDLGVAQARSQPPRGSQRGKP